MLHSNSIVGASLVTVPFLALACVPPGDGVPPPADRIYFPVSLAISESGDHLFVVNSDFDLQFAQGTIQSLDVARIRDVSQRVCSADRDCSSGEMCDRVPTDQNRGFPSFSCVGASGVPCEGLGEKSSGDLSFAPGRCAPVDLTSPFDGGPSLIVDVAETSAFATQGLLLPRPCLENGNLVPCSVGGANERVTSSGGGSAPERLFVPVRGDTTVHYLDIDEAGHFICGRPVEGSSGAISPKEEGALRCSKSYRVSRGVTFGLDRNGDVTTTSRPPDPQVDEDEKVSEGDPVAAFRLPPEPLDIAASHDGRVLVVTHQLDGYASTLVNSWTRPPALVHIASGLPDNPIGVVALPMSDEMQSLGKPGFLVTFRSDAQVNLLRFHDDNLLQALGPEGPSQELVDGSPRVFRPELFNIASSPITLNTSGFDSRGIVMDDTRRQRSVALCAGDEECVAGASRVPLDVYVANRSPSSLLVGRTAGEDPDALVSALPRFYDSYPLSAGPSRIVLGHVVGPSGAKEPRVFVLCFDAALVYVYNPETRTIESEIRTGRGPYSMAFDPESSLAFIGHFTDSYVGVVSLDQRHPMTFGATVATLGDPEPPRASQ
jgi:hypothetical protein